MPLDPDVVAILEQLAPFDPRLSPEAMRLAGEAGRPPRSGDQGVQVEDVTIPGPAGPIDARRYLPAGMASEPGLLVYYHGGGFVLGDLESHDGICRDLASGAGVVLLSVDYRLAPEHPFPDGVTDAWASLAWAHEHAGDLDADPEKLAVGGDSAGGNLAAVVALMARDVGLPLRLQVLVYPVTDMTEKRLADRVRDDTGIFLTSEAMLWFERHYRADRDDWRASPLLATDLSDVAPAVVLTCEYDPLRAEGDEYAERLGAAGVPVAHRSYAGLTHGIFGMGALVPAAQLLMDDCCSAIRAAFSE